VAGDEVLQESPGQVRVVEVAQVILHGLDLVDHQRGFRPQNLREEFQRVAQALELDAQGVEGLDRGAGEHRLVGADGLVAGVDQGRRQVAGKVSGGRFRADVPGARAGGRQEGGEGFHEAGEGRAVEVIDQAGAGGFPLGGAIVQQRGQAVPRPGGQACPVAQQPVEKDVHVAHGAQGARRIAQGALEGPDRLAAVEGREDTQRAAHAPGGDAHIVDSLDIFPQAATRLMKQHTLEVEVERLAPGLAHRVFGGDAGLFVQAERQAGLFRRRRSRLRVAPGRHQDSQPVLAEGVLPAPHLALRQPDGSRNPGDRDAFRAEDDDLRPALHRRRVAGQRRLKGGGLVRGQGQGLRWHWLLLRRKLAHGLHRSGADQSSSLSANICEQSVASGC